MLLKSRQILALLDRGHSSTDSDTSASLTAGAINLEAKSLMKADPLVNNTKLYILPQAQ